MSKFKISFLFILLFILIGVLSLLIASEVSSPCIENIKGIDQVNHSKAVSQTNQDGMHRAHIEFQNNTNSCRSCHEPLSTAPNTRFYQNVVYSACTTCHDGSLGIYNVFAGNDSSGTFGGTYSGNMSIHSVNSALENKAAPGGDRKSLADKWTGEFTCGSCHNPHGSYSDRLLSANPNNMGNITADKGGKRLDGVPVVTTLTGATASFVLLKFTLLDDASQTSPDPTTGPEYLNKGLVKGDVVIQLYKKSGTAYIPDQDPWLNGYDWTSGYPRKMYWTSFYESPELPQLLHTGMVKEGIIAGNGFIAAKADNAATLFPSTITMAKISRAYVVKLDVRPSTNSTQSAFPVTTTNVATLWTTSDGRGRAMSAFCSSCHTDYLAKSGSLTGLFSHAYRHTTISDKFTCVRCHYAHGTDVSIMKDAQQESVQQIVADVRYFPDIKNLPVRTELARDYMLDKNPSSALKRYTNMAICWTCHHDSASFVNSDSNKFYSGSVQP